MLRAGSESAVRPATSPGRSATMSCSACTSGTGTAPFSIQMSPFWLASSAIPKMACVATARPPSPSDPVHALRTTSAVAPALPRNSAVLHAAITRWSARRARCSSAITCRHWPVNRSAIHSTSPKIRSSFAQSGIVPSRFRYSARRSGWAQKGLAR